MKAEQVSGQRTRTTLSIGLVYILLFALASPLVLPIATVAAQAPPLVVNVGSVAVTDAVPSAIAPVPIIVNCSPDGFTYRATWAIDDNRPTNPFPAITKQVEFLVTISGHQAAVPTAVFGSASHAQSYTRANGAPPAFHANGVLDISLPQTFAEVLQFTLKARFSDNGGAVWVESVFPAPVSVDCNPSPEWTVTSSQTMNGNLFLDSFTLTSGDTITTTTGLTITASEMEIAGTIQGAGGSTLNPDGASITLISCARQIISGIVRGGDGFNYPAAGSFSGTDQGIGKKGGSGGDVDIRPCIPHVDVPTCDEALGKFEFPDGAFILGGDAGNGQTVSSSFLLFNANGETADQTLIGGEGGEGGAVNIQYLITPCTTPADDLAGTAQSGDGGDGGNAVLQAGYASAVGLNSLNGLLEGKSPHIRAIGGRGGDAGLVALRLVPEATDDRMEAEVSRGKGGDGGIARATSIESLPSCYVLGETGYTILLGSDVPAGCEGIPVQGDAENPSYCTEYVLDPLCSPPLGGIPGVPGISATALGGLGGDGSPGGHGGNALSRAGDGGIGAPSFRGGNCQQAPCHAPAGSGGKGGDAKSAGGESGDDRNAACDGCYSTYGFGASGGAAVATAGFGGDGNVEFDATPGGWCDETGGTCEGGGPGGSGGPGGNADATGGTGMDGPLRGGDGGYAIASGGRGGNGGAGAVGKSCPFPLTIENCEAGPGGPGGQGGQGGASIANSGKGGDADMESPNTISPRWAGSGGFAMAVASGGGGHGGPGGDAGDCTNTHPRRCAKGGDGGNGGRGANTEAIAKPGGKGKSGGDGGWTAAEQAPGGRGGIAGRGADCQNMVTGDNCAAGPGGIGGSTGLVSAKTLATGGDAGASGAGDVGHGGDAWAFHHVGFGAPDGGAGGNGACKGVGGQGGHGDPPLPARPEVQATGGNNAESPGDSGTGHKQAKYDLPGSAADGSPGPDGSVGTACTP